MKNYFPPINQKYTYLQTNRSNVLGSLWSSLCLDFQSNLGVMRIGNRFEINTKTGDSGATNLGIPAAFKFFDQRMFTIAGTRIFKNSGINITSAFVEDASSGVVTTFDSANSDMEIFNDSLCVNNGFGTNNKLYSKARDGAGTGTWTDRGSLGSGSAFVLKYFPLKDRLYAAQGALISSVSSSWAVSTSGDYTLNLDQGSSALFGNISCLAVDNYSMWIGVNKNTSSAEINEQCVVLQWDGLSPQPDNQYLVPAGGIMAIVMRNNIPVIMDSNGILREFQGTYFKEIGRLPLKPNQTLGFTTNSSNVDRFIAPNGMIVTENNTILVLIRNTNVYKISTVPNVNENLSSGVWEWSEENGFTHKQPLTYTQSGTSTITDFGQNIVSAVGALVSAKIETQNSMPTIIGGAEYFTDATATKDAIFINQPKPSDVSFPDVQKKGYFVTSWFTSNEIEDKWERLWSVYKRFLTATDSIVFKYRLYEEDPVVVTITWVNVNSFTTTTDVTSYWTSAVGGEVEVLQGTGGGACAHILSIVNNAGTYTVTLDDTITGVTTGTAKARFQKWVRLNPTINGIVKSWQQMAIGANNTRIQIKGCITWTGDGEFYKFAVFSNEDIKINA